MDADTRRQIIRGYRALAFSSRITKDGLEGRWLGLLAEWTARHADAIRRTA